MLEAGEIVVATLGVATLFFLCCGIMACMMMFDRDRKPPPSRLDRTLPPISVQPISYQADKPEYGQQRQRRNSGTQTDEINGIVVQEEDLRTESSFTTARPHNLYFQKRLPMGATQAEAIHTQHNTASFLEDLRQLRSSRHSVFNDEFEILRRRATSRWKSREVAGMNNRQNRFDDVAPYDDNRVPLQQGEYINASFIDSYLSSKHFIATQWPLGYEELPGKESTVEDFWKMTWGQRVEAIITFSGMHDNLPTFWPPLRAIRRFGDITVEQDRSYEEAGVLVRLFSLTKQEERRRVHQFHITDWEDGGITDSDKILHICQKTRDFPTPIIVHCSAGIGRTGVFIAVFRLLSQANQRGLIDVFSIVDSMRQQRIGMVQTKEQYESIYEILRRAVETRLIARHSRI